MFVCLFCGSESRSDTAKYCPNCGPNGPAVGWHIGDVDHPSNIDKYLDVLTDLFYELKNPADFKEVRDQIRSRLKISYLTDQRIIKELERQEAASSEFSLFDVEINTNFGDFYAGHDSHLSFRVTNNSSSYFCKCTISWKDKSKDVGLAFNAVSDGYVKHNNSKIISSTLIFERIGVKEISGVKLQLSNQYDESACFRLSPFTFCVKSTTNLVVQNITANNQISISGRGVVDASIPKGNLILKDQLISDTPNWVTLNKRLIFDLQSVKKAILCNDTELFSQRDESSSFSHQEVCSVVPSYPEVKIGAVYDGVVFNVTELGCFINLFPELGGSANKFVKGRDGALHVSQLPTNLTKEGKPSIEVGQNIRVKVLEIDKHGKFSGRPRLTAKL